MLEAHFLVNNVITSWAQKMVFWEEHILGTYLLATHKGITKGVIYFYIWYALLTFLSLILSLYNHKTDV